MSYTIRLICGTSLTMRTLWSRNHHKTHETSENSHFFLYFSFSKFFFPLVGMPFVAVTGYEVKHNADTVARGAPLVCLSLCLSLFPLLRCPLWAVMALVVPKAKIVLSIEINKFRGYVVGICGLCPPVSVAMDGKLDHTVAVPGR